MSVIRRATAVVQTDTASNGGSATSVGASDTALVSANNARVELTITNDHATQLVYLKLGGTAEVNKGIRLNAAGGSWTTHAYLGAVRAIATGASTTVLVVEV